MIKPTDQPRIGSAGRSRPSTANRLKEEKKSIDSFNTNDKYNQGNEFLLCYSFQYLPAMNIVTVTI